MITNLWNVLCKRVIVDRQTNLVSYIDCINDLQARKLPAILPSLDLGTIWLIEPQKSKQEKFMLRVRLFRPDGKSKTLFETPEKAFKDKKRERVNFHIRGISVEMVGVYRFTLEYKSGSKWISTKDLFLEIGEIPEQKVKAKKLGTNPAQRINSN